MGKLNEWQAFLHGDDRVRDLLATSVMTAENAAYAVVLLRGRVDEYLFGTLEESLIGAFGNKVRGLMLAWLHVRSSAGYDYQLIMALQSVITGIREVQQVKDCALEILGIYAQKLVKSKNSSIGLLLECFTKDQGRPAELPAWFSSLTVNKPLHLLPHRDSWETIHTIYLKYGKTWEASQIQFWIGTETKKEKSIE